MSIKSNAQRENSLRTIAQHNNLGQEEGLPPLTSHRTVQVLFTYGSSGRKVSLLEDPPIVSRFTTTTIPVQVPSVLERLQLA